MIRAWLKRVSSDPAIRDKARTVLMVGPNLAKLMIGLARDPRVPRRVKILAAAAAAYIVSPVDLLPDFIPFIGRSDDIVIVALVLDSLIQQVGLPVIKEHWDGPDEVLAVVVDVVDVIAGLVPRPVRIAVNAYMRR